MVVSGNGSDKVVSPVVSEESYIFLFQRNHPCRALALSPHPTSQLLIGTELFKSFQ